jgi:serine/threonine-protein kinase
MTIVFSALGEDHRSQIFQRRLDSFEALPISGTEEASTMTFSPDGEWLAFINPEGLQKVTLKGGSPVVLATDASPLGVAWAKDDTIFYVKGFTSGIYSVPAGGGPPKKVTPEDTSSRERTQVWPEVLPNQKGLIYTVWTGKSFNDARIDCLKFKTGERRVLIEGGTGAKYIPNGRIAFARNGTLFTAPFDEDSLTVTGASVPANDGVMMGAANGNADFAVSKSGNLVYLPGSFQTFQRNLVWMDRTGKITKLREEIQPYATPAISPDGTRIALTMEGSSFDVWVYDLRRDLLTKASFGADDYRPRISPNGKMLAYDSSQSGQQQLHVKNGILEGTDTIVTNTPEDKEFYGWTVDGRELIFGKHTKETGWDIYAVSVEGEHKVRPLITAPFNQNNASLSPDGKWLAYVSDESGQNEVFVVSMTDATSRAQLSTGGGRQPRWSKNGNELTFVRKDTLMSVKFAGGNVLNPEKPVALFDDKADWTGYDVAADGRFLVAREADNKKSGTQLNVVLNWVDTLKK